jgi:phosphoenolpyruvate-protein kinase (PTS system EI component)
VLRLVDHVVRAARKYDRWVGVCGEAAGDVTAVPVLVGLGVTELSMAAPAIPAVKERLRNTRLADAGELARAALAAESATDVRRLVDETGSRA